MCLRGGSIYTHTHSRVRLAPDSCCGCRRDTFPRAWHMAGSWLFVSAPDISDKLTPLCEWKCVWGGGGKKNRWIISFAQSVGSLTHVLPCTAPPVTSGACKKRKATKTYYRRGLLSRRRDGGRMKDGGVETRGGWKDARGSEGANGEEANRIKGLLREGLRGEAAGINRRGTPS